MANESFTCHMTSKQRLIDANALRDDTYILDSWDAKIVRAWLDDQPTVDAVEVVRCKDCQSFYNGYHCMRMQVRVRSDHFCSYGERREGE